MNEFVGQHALVYFDDETSSISMRVAAITAVFHCVECQADLVSADHVQFHYARDHHVIRTVETTYHKTCINVKTGEPV
jgi:hypothetical protein